MNLVDRMTKNLEVFIDYHAVSSKFLDKSNGSIKIFSLPALSVDNFLHDKHIRIVKLVAVPFP